MMKNTINMESERGSGVVLLFIILLFVAAWGLVWVRSPATSFKEDTRQRSVKCYDKGAVIFEGTSVGPIIRANGEQIIYTSNHMRVSVGDQNQCIEILDEQTSKDSSREKEQL